MGYEKSFLGHSRSGSGIVWDVARRDDYFTFKVCSIAIQDLFALM